MLIEIFYSSKFSPCGLAIFIFSGSTSALLLQRAHSPLLGAGKLATNNCALALGNVQASIVAGKTQQAAQQLLEAAPCGGAPMAAPFGHQALAREARVQGSSAACPPSRPAHNMHRIKPKEILADYLHRAAGSPPKRAWLQVLKCSGCKAALQKQRAARLLKMVCLKWLTAAHIGAL